MRKGLFCQKFQALAGLVSQHTIGLCSYGYIFLIDKCLPFALPNQNKDITVPVTCKKNGFDAPSPWFKLSQRSRRPLRNMKRRRNTPPPSMKVDKNDIDITISPSRITP